MAKSKAEITLAQKATLDASLAVSKAREADNKASTDATKKHLATTKDYLRKCVTVENRERFVRVGGGRIKKARTAIRNFGNVAALRSYVYNEDDIGKAETALQDEVKKVISRLRTALTRGGISKTEDDFTF